MSTTLINSFSEVELPATLFEAHFTIEAPEEITKIGVAHLESRFDFTAIEDLLLIDEALFENSFELELNGFLNNEPNITDEIYFDTGLEFVANDATFSEALALFNFSLEFEAVEEITEAESSIFTLIVDVVPESVASSNYITQRGRLKVDGVEIPFVTATYSEPNGRSGSELSIQLARLSDKSLITQDAFIEFEIGDKIDGVWSNVETLFSTAELNGVQQTNFSLSYRDNAPADTFSFSSVSDFSRKFSKSPTRNLVIYDSLKLTLTVDDFEPIYDTNGLRYDVELVPVANLSFYDLISRVIEDRCGFTDVQTNIANFPIARIDCPIGQSFMQSVSGYFGMFEPDIYEDESGTLWIEDTTNTLPSGFPAPRSINIESWTNAEKSSNQKRVDALLVSYSADQRNFDYTTTRSVVTIGEETGTILQDNYTSTVREKFYREYRRFSNPTLVIASNLERETATTTNRFSIVVAEYDERYTYDEQGRLTKRTKRQSSIIPTLPSSSPHYSLQDVLNEEERLEYKQLPFRVKDYYLSKRTLDVTGTIAYDPDAPQLGRDYKQGVVDAIRSGNLTETTVIVLDVPIKSVVELATPKPDGTVSVRITEIDHLNNVQSYTVNEDRAGDVGLSTFASKQKVILVFDSDIPTPSFDRVEAFSAGELGVKAAVALARRVLIKRKTRSNVINFVKIGFDSSYRKGSAVTVNERGTSPVRSLGVYKIKSRSVTVNRNGVLMSFNGEQL